jgi:hypothetical protein
MGVAAARLVMVEGVDDDGKPRDAQPVARSVLAPVLALLGITVARAAGVLAGGHVPQRVHSCPQPPRFLSPR